MHLKDNQKSLHQIINRSTGRNKNNMQPTISALDEDWNISGSDDEGDLSHGLKNNPKSDSGIKLPLESRDTH